MNKFFGHLNTVLTHKKYVRQYGKQLGLGFWARNLHDISKFNPIEFFEGVKYWTGTSSPIDACKKECGYSKAWFHHRGRNKHHYEYWVDHLDDGGKPGLMPYRYSLEMLCDYLAAGKAYMGDKFTYEAEYKWWLAKKAKPLMMHEVQKQFIAKCLSFAAEYNYLPSARTVENIFYTELAKYSKEK